MKIFFRSLLLSTSTASLLALLAGGCSMQDFGGGDEVTDAMAGAGGTQGAQATEIRSEKLAHLLVAWRQQNGTPEEDYQVGPGDVLEINIFALEHPGQPSVLSRAVNVEGSVNLPFIGDLNLTGLTTRQAIKAVANAYDGAYLRKPQVAVTVTEYRSAPVVVTGAVKLPGIYYLRRQSSTVLEMLSMANGLAPEAGNELLIVRGEEPQGAESATNNVAEPEVVPDVVAAEPVAPAESNAPEPQVSSVLPVLEPTQIQPESQTDQKASKRKGKKKDLPSEPPPEPEAEASAADEAMSDEDVPSPDDQMVSVDLRRLLDSGDIRHNVIVRGGDVITVPPHKKEFVYILGYVQRPGAVEVREDQHMQALHAVAMAGGLSTSARAQNSTLITEKDGRRKTIPVDLTSMKRGRSPPAYLKPGDILIVGSSSMAKIAEFLKLSAGASISPVP